jgi:hypothetical protein
MKKRVLFLVYFLLQSVLIYSQDTIVQKSGVKHSCKIKSMDSTTVYFTKETNGIKINSSIKRSEVVFIRFYNPIHTSTQPKRSSLDLSMGLSSAISNYGSKDLNSSSAGLASNGFNLNVTFSYNYNIHFGLTIKGYLGSNRFVTNGFAAQLSKSSGYNFINDTVSYMNRGIMIGPDYIFLGKRFSFIIHLLLGFSSLTEPEATFTTYTGGYGWIKMDAASANGFVVDNGGSLIFTMKKDWYFIMNLDYIASHYTFGNISMSALNGSIQNFNRGVQSYEVINISGGVGVKF